MAKLEKSYKGTVVVIDDEPELCRVLTRALNVEGYHINAFTNPRQALDYIRSYEPDLVLTDIRMPEMDGMQVLKEVKQLNPHIIVIIITAYGSIEGAIEAMREGAFHYVIKPFQLQELVLTVDKAMQHKKLADETFSYSEHQRRQFEGMEIVGESEAIKGVKELLLKIAPTDAPVLIRGESGTGKELVARTLHQLSPRRDKRFVPINCAAIPETLIESELFGYERGAFTGADKTKLGLIELANGGTLFLDEIGELPLALQAKLLRVLQEHEIQRLGGVKVIPVDLRLVAATNQDLEAAIQQRKFRRDLFYRLNVINILIPPLRERPEDVAILVRFFLDKFAQKMRRPRINISQRALKYLHKYLWPGNVRELQNILERMLVLSNASLLTEQELPADILSDTERTGHPEPPTADQDFRSARQEFERRYFADLLSSTHGNVSEAARLAGLSRQQLYEKMQKLELHPDTFKSP